MIMGSENLQKSTKERKMKILHLRWTTKYYVSTYSYEYSGRVCAARVPYWQTQQKHMQANTVIATLQELYVIPYSNFAE